MTESVRRLGPEVTGRWWVVTQGSEHLFDFDNEVYERHQLDGLNPMEFDRTPMVLDRNLIQWWPEVGGVFRLMIPVATGDQFAVAKMRTSSVIREIRRAE